MLTYNYACLFEFMPLCEELLRISRLVKDCAGSMDCWVVCIL